MTVPSFPVLAGQTYPAKRSPVWSTLHQEAVSGKDTPLQLWTYPRWRYELPFSFLRAAPTQIEFQTMAAFFNSLGGSAGVFQFTDPDDNAVTDQNFGTGDGATTAFGLVRAMTGTGVSFAEPVFSPVPTPVIKINGTPTVLFTLGSAGLITFNSPPAGAAVLTWTGSFTWLCRLDDDVAEFQNFVKAIYDLGKINFTTIKTNFA